MRKALIVGVNSYPDIPLKGCINDARAITKLLERHENSTKNFDTNLVENILSKSKLKKLIVELFKSTCETALFYFSGHGAINSFGGQIVTPDYKEEDEGISMDDILKLANESPSTNKVIILDCCHSGKFGTFSNSVLTQINKGVTILASSLENESSIEVNGHGIFTNLLIEALHGGAADIIGRISPGSIYSFVDNSLGSWDQRPIFKTNITNFISLRDVNPSINVEVLRKLTDYFITPEYEYKLSPEYEYTHEFAKKDKVVIFQNMQKLTSIGLIRPIGAEHMYWAAINNESCMLTTIGMHYWRLVKDKRI